MAISAAALLARCDQSMRHGQFADALLDAKAVLDLVPAPTLAGTCSGGARNARLRAWRVMASALQAVGDLETAYCLAAKGVQEARRSGGDDQGLAADSMGIIAALCHGDGISAAARRTRALELAKSWHDLSGAARTAPASSISEVTQRPALESRLLLQHGDVGTARAAGGTGSSSAAERSEGTFASASQPRVLCLSDLHADQHNNLRHLQSISKTAYGQDILIVAGDVADSMTAIRSALSLLITRFKRVFYLPGNHCLWLRPGSKDELLYPDSVCKLLSLLAMCDELGVDTAAAEVVPGLRIVPLYSWYCHSFDTRDPRPGQYRFDKFCRWPVCDLDVWQLMLKMNEGAALRQCLAWQHQDCPDQKAAPVTGGHIDASSRGANSTASVTSGTGPATSTVSGSSTDVGRDGCTNGLNGAGHDRIAVGSALGSAGAPQLAQGLAQLNLSTCASGNATGHADDLTATPPRPRSLHANASGGYACSHQSRAHCSAPPAQLSAAAAVAPVPLAPADVKEHCSGAQPPPTIITFSHFLPREELPFSRGPAEMAKAMGCLELDLQIELAGSDLHVYGHTHINTDMPLIRNSVLKSQAAAIAAGRRNVATIQGSVGSRGGERRYVHHSLEGWHRPELLCVWDGNQLTHECLSV